MLSLETFRRTAEDLAPRVDEGCAEEIAYCC